MKTMRKDSAAVRIPPPIFFLVCLGAGLMLESRLPDLFIRSPWIPGLIIGGLITFMAGCLALSAFWEMIRNKTPFNTFSPTTRIIQEGVYGYSRNPMYLSLLLLNSGIAVIRSSIGVLISVPVLYFLLLFLAIKPEERYLAEKFGKEYKDYLTRVRRWL